jgi:hypothetical protein
MIRYYVSPVSLTIQNRISSIQNCVLYKQNRDTTNQRDYMFFGELHSPIIILISCFTVIILIVLLIFLINNVDIDLRPGVIGLLFIPIVTCLFLFLYLFISYLINLGIIMWRLTKIQLMKTFTTLNIFLSPIAVYMYMIITIIFIIMTCLIGLIPSRFHLIIIKVVSLFFLTVILSLYIFFLITFRTKIRFSLIHAIIIICIMLLIANNKHKIHQSLNGICLFAWRYYWLTIIISLLILGLAGYRVFTLFNFSWRDTIVIK